MDQSRVDSLTDPKVTDNTDNTDTLTDNTDNTDNTDRLIDWKDRISISASCKLQR
jgi:hypothetical protein